MWILHQSHEYPKFINDARCYPVGGHWLLHIIPRALLKETEGHGEETRLYPQFCFRVCSTWLCWLPRWQDFMVHVYRCHPDLITHRSSPSPASRSYLLSCSKVKLEEDGSSVGWEMANIVILGIFINRSPLTSSQRSRSFLEDFLNS